MPVYIQTSTLPSVVENVTRTSVDVLRKDSYERKSTASDVQISSWANSVLDLKNSQADPLIQNLLESMPVDDIDALNKLERQKNRQDALYLLYAQQPEVFCPIDVPSYTYDNCTLCSHCIFSMIDMTI